MPARQHAGQRLTAEIFAAGSMNPAAGHRGVPHRGQYEYSTAVAALALALDLVM